MVGARPDATSAKIAARFHARHFGLPQTGGYTVANDVTARDHQHTDGQWTRGKGHDTFCPTGPWIVTDVDPADLELRTEVNGDVKQDSRTSDLLFDVPHLVSELSKAFTFEPGDLIMTGTPSGVGPIKPGDVMEVEIEGIGVLRNPVAAER